ncbi:MAG: DNA primase regulatory subunit PriL [Haloarculaceae archaeon]
MRALHARYPFLEASREAVDRADVDLAEVVAREGPVLDRAMERVSRAIHDGSVGEADRSTRVELLSYPVARVIVSLVDERILTRRYASAEATTAYERFTDELDAREALKSAGDDQLTLDQLLGEFDLGSQVRTVDGGEATDYRVRVGAYLEYAAGEWDDSWRLVNRELDEGEVPLTASELRLLLRQAIRRRVEADLPFDVPPAVGDHLEAHTETIREWLADLDLTRDIDTVVPELFPPCMKALLDDVQKGEHLEHHSRFAIASFLTTIGMTTDEIVELFEVNPGFGEEATRYQVDHIRGDTSPTEYSPPACATMQSYGDCVNKDDICEDVIDESHPLNYYEHRLDEADEDDVQDWRAGEDGDGEDDGEAEGKTTDGDGGDGTASGEVDGQDSKS